MLCDLPGVDRVLGGLAILAERGPVDVDAGRDLKEAKTCFGEQGGDTKASGTVSPRTCVVNHFGARHFLFSTSSNKKERRRRRIKMFQLPLPSSGMRTSSEQSISHRLDPNCRSQRDKDRVHIFHPHRR